jgi:ubiquinone/menaquinone biosynthesis C-methylase UbiE
MIAYVCPWWSAPFTIDTPLRRWLHDPQKVVGPYVRPAMTVIDVGCGPGWFAVPMAKMVGDGGKVVAVDLQPQMLEMVGRRAAKVGVAARIELHKCEPDRLGIATQADFALVFAMLHEVPDQRRLLTEIHACLKPGGKLLLAEPPIHVTRKKFADEKAVAEQVGFSVVSEPHVRWCRAALFMKADAQGKTG